MLKRLIFACSFLMSGPAVAEGAPDYLLALPDCSVRNEACVSITAYSPSQSAAPQFSSMRPYEGTQSLSVSLRRPGSDEIENRDLLAFEMADGCGSALALSLRGYSKTGSPVIRTIEGDVELIAHNLELGTKSFITFHAGTGEYLEDLFLPSDSPRHEPFYADQDGLIWYQVRDDNDCYAAINEATPQLISDRAQCQPDAETEFGIIGAEAIENPKSISGPLSENEDFLWLVDRFQGPVWQIDGTEIVIVDIREPCS